MNLGSLWIFVIAAGIALIFAIIASFALKFFARPLAYVQALAISIIAFEVGLLFYFVCTFILVMLPFRTSEFLPVAGMLIVAAVMISKLARKSGIETSGVFGVGAKSVLGFIVLAGVPVLILTAIKHWA